ncbi:MAG: hypothetical protein R3A47_05400 [Polyangiales bacterium]
MIDSLEEFDSGFNDGIPDYLQVLALQSVSGGLSGGSLGCAVVNGAPSSLSTNGTMWWFITLTTAIVGRRRTNRNRVRAKVRRNEFDERA